MVKKIYKVLVVDIEVMDLEDVLNSFAKEGWRYVDTMNPASNDRTWILRVLMEKDDQ